MSSMGYLRRQKADLDRLSGLPEEVLGRILSFMPYQQAVRTSVLARPWRHVWRLVPDLDIHDSCLDRARYDLNRVWWYLVSVNRALTCREIPIRRFSLRCRHPCHAACLGSWIAAAIDASVREVYIHLNPDYIECVPALLFTCETLTHLVLRGGIEVDLANKAVSLPNVKNIRFDWVRFTSLGSIERILRACPVLEEFDIRRRSDDEELIVNITVPTLKILTYNFRKSFRDRHPPPPESDTETEEEENEGEEFGNVIDNDNNEEEEEEEEEGLKYELIVNTPNLEALHLNDKVTDKYIVKDGVWSWLDDAYVNVHETACALEIVEAISNAKSIALSGRTLGCLVAGDNVFPTFHNLTKLELGISHSCLEFVNEFLEKSPNLELLIFEKESHTFKYEWSYWIAPLFVPRCLMMTLKEIIFEDFFGYEYELDLLEYLLENGRVLEDVTVRCPKYVTSDVCDTIAELPRRCQLYVLRYERRIPMK